LSHTTSKLFSLLICSWLVAELPQAVIAQTAEDQNTGQLAEITVTAQKRSEHVQDVPASISVVSGADLKEQGFENLVDLTRSIPGLVMSQLGAFAAPTIRGVQSNSPGSPNQEQNTAVFLDGAYLQSGAGLLSNLPDIEQVEVLKGPQSTLAGRDAEGGAIYIKTLQPSDVFTASFNATGGKYIGGDATYGANGFISGPLFGDTLTGSLSAGYSRDSGYVHSAADNGGVTNNGYSGFIRGKLFSRPMDNMTTLVTAYYTQSNIPSQTQFEPQACSLTAGFSVCQPIRPWYYQGNSDGLNQAQQQGASLVNELTFPAGTLRSVTSYNRNIYHAAFDSDGTLAAIQFLLPNINTQMIGQDFNFASRSYGPFKYIAGVTYMNIHDDWDPINIGATQQAPYFATLYGYFHTNTYGAYAEGNYDVTDKVELALGARFSKDQKAYLAGAGFPPNTASAGPPYTPIGDTDWNNWSPRASVKYKVDPYSNLYLTYSEGYKAGAYTNTSYSPATVGPETLKSIELGYKLARDVFRFNAAVFHYKLDNIQVITVYSLPNGSISTRSQNAASGRYDGLDVDFDYLASSAFRISGGFLWEPDAKYTSFPNANVVLPVAGGGLVSTTTDGSGARVPLAPKFSGNLGATYTWGSTPGNLVFGANLHYSSLFTYELSGTLRQPEFATLNAHLDWVPASGHVTYSVWGKNITNKAYYGSYFSATTYDAESWAPPAEVGLSFSYKY
jgi:iron complex outermembrane receptor protein